MAITEESRHQLYQRLEEVLGREQATTLMEHLPPVGWADVATKRDLDHVEAATSRDIEDLRVATSRDIENLGNVLRVELHRELRSLLFSVMASNAALVGLLFAAVRLA